MKITIGIITFNRPETLCLVLDAIENQVNLKGLVQKPFEVIVVDNSTNNETEKIVKKYKKIEYIRVRERIFQPQARNIIVKKCKGDVLAFLDDDAVPEPQWLSSVEDGYMQNDKKGRKVLGVTGPAINCTKPGNPTEKIIRSKKNRNFFTSYGDVHSDAKRWVPPQPTTCTVMLGANMSFLTEELKKVGFDEFYGKDAAFREESDPQVAIVKKGGVFIYHPSALVWHMKFSKGGIRSNPPKNYYYYCGVNHRYFSDKYFPKWKSRLAWIFFSISPPCLWLTVILTIIRRDKSILKWQKGLWGK